MGCGASSGVGDHERLAAGLTYPDFLELVGSELVRRAADRAKRREEKLKAMQEGRDGGEPAES